MAADLRSMSLWELDGWKAPVAWLVVVVLLLGRKPRLAFMAATAATTLTALHLLQSPIAYQLPVTETLDGLVVPVAATLLLSSATRAQRGVELVGTRGVRLAAVAAGLMQLVPIAIGFSFNRIGILAVEIGMGTNLMALVTLLAIATAVARRTGRDVARRVAVAGVVVASFLLASLLVRWGGASTPLHRGDIGIVLVVAAVVPVALVGIGRRVPRLVRNQARSAHAA